MRNVGKYRISSDWHSGDEGATISLALVDRLSHGSLLFSSVLMQSGLEVDERVLAADLERVLLKHFGHQGPALTLTPPG